ncbi:calcium-binding protein [Spongiactinospora gelatinilytica]|uniref:Calcium-binding protein n=1 Tax=Spongiactinospora gelatinilytica TaxID=2666298 RepID=A0A2W2HGK9_9ACTN|nr:SMP-30/gluconolactonase/LRE family protein [Spongiactinospora gelatinilytica]PZG54149.1 calcium-binding protein [Spongiactinospora gelatinilytica]
MKIDVALPVRAALGEGPTWYHDRLIWVDIPACEVHEYIPASGTDSVREVPQHVGAAKPRAGGGLVVNLRDGAGLLAAGGGFRWLAEWPIEGRRGNDAGVDPHGNLWAGTLSYGGGGGSLYRVTPDGEVVTFLDRVGTSNGIAWSPDGALMYYVDTDTGRVDVFDTDPEGGLPRGRRTFAEIDRGLPDGITVDADGCVWVALWDGAAVRRYTPGGDLDREVEVPVSRPTACAFGGPGLADLYITSATEGLPEATLAAEPLSGALLVVPSAGLGLPGTPFAG